MTEEEYKEKYEHLMMDKLNEKDLEKRKKINELMEELKRKHKKELGEQIMNNRKKEIK